jgi:hypothetical protein
MVFETQFTKSMFIVAVVVRQYQKGEEVGSRSDWDLAHHLLCQARKVRSGETLGIFYNGKLVENRPS